MNHNLDIDALAAEIAAHSLNGESIDELVEKRKRYHIADAAARKLARESTADKEFTIPDCIETLEDELANPSEGPKYAVEQLLVHGGNALISAQRKTGKTVLALNLAKAYVDNTLFLGRFGVAPLSDAGRVLILNYELTPQQFSEWSGGLGIVNTKLITALHLRGQSFRLGSPSARNWLVERCKRLNVEAIIVDPYSRAFRGFGKENDNTDAGAFTDTLDEIKYRAGARELFLTNHMGWGEDERSRGASALEDWPDALWRLTKKDDVRYFSAPLGRGVELAEGSLEFNSDTRELTYADGGRASNTTDRAGELILEFVRANPGCGSREIEAGVKGVSKTVLPRARKKLIEEERIRIRNEGKKVLHFAREIKMENGRVRIT